MSKTFATTVAVAALLMFAPALPGIDQTDGSAAFANSGNGNGNGNGNGGGNGNGNGNAGGNGNSAKDGSGSNGKSAANGKTAKATGTSASELGKMNGALHASPQAVIAHIKNGQITNGPVGLMAGLAVADAGVAAASADLAGLQDKAAAFDALETAVADAGFDSVEGYLQAKADGTATEEQMNAIDPLVDAVGGTTEDGLALAETAPTDAEIAEAEAAVDAAEAAVDTVEASIGAAWNKDGDLAGLLGQMRERLAEYQTEIAAALVATEGE